MSEQLSFNFYSVLKNEDAPPFVGKDFLVVADGLGGAGSTVHKIDYEQHPDLRGELMEAAYGDFDKDTAEKISDYLDTLLEPLADRTPDTSALWASRIVIGRFVYAMLNKAIPAEVSAPETVKESKKKVERDCGPSCDSVDDGHECCNEADETASPSEAPVKKEQIKIDITNETDRAALADFINLGLERVATALSLKCGEYSGQRLLPTTLAAICFDERETTVGVDCIWAGDSRCYLLTPSGLKLLSEDDEDSTGAITNLFYVGTKKAVLRYRHYEIEKPCALMSVSDGIFDPVADEDYWGVEYFFQNAISESSSFEELSAKLKENFDAIKGDDSTFAFHAFGFDGYADMKQKLESRTKHITDISKQWQYLRNAIAFMNAPESDVSGYVLSRTSDKYQSIVPILTQLLLDGTDDAAISRNMVERINTARKESEESQKNAGIKAQAEALQEAYKVLCADPGLIKTVFSSKNLSTVPEAYDQYKLLLQLAAELKKYAVVGEKSSQKLAQIQAERENAAREIAAKIEDYHKALRILAREPKTAENRKIWADALRQEILWHIIEYAFLHKSKYRKWQDIYTGNGVLAIPLYKNQKSLKSDSLANKIFEIWDKETKLIVHSKSNQSELSKLRPQYESLLRSILNKLEGTEAPLSFFKEDFVQTLGVKEISPVDFESMLPELVEKMFASQKDMIVAEIVKSLAENYGKTSAIDSMYNATRLARFREYYKYKNSPNNEVVSLSKDFEAIKLEYYSMINCNAK